MSFISIFRDGKLKPGVYKIRNTASQTYVDIQDNQKDLCCRPLSVLGDKGQWEIIPLGPGYTIRRLESGGPDQFCTVLDGQMDAHGRTSVSVSTFPAVWRVELVQDQSTCGCENVCFFWGATEVTWDLSDYGAKEDGTPVHYGGGRHILPCRIWKLIPT